MNEIPSPPVPEALEKHRHSKLVIASIILAFIVLTLIIPSAVYRFTDGAVSRFFEDIYFYASFGGPVIILLGLGLGMIAVFREGTRKQLDNFGIAINYFLMLVLFIMWSMITGYSPQVVFSFLAVSLVGLGLGIFAVLRKNVRRKTVITAIIICYILVTLFFCGIMFVTFGMLI